MHRTEYERLLAAAYKCPGDNASWVQLAHDLGRAYAADHTHLVVLDPAGTIEADVVTERDAGRKYVQDYASRDIALPRVMASKRGHVIWSHELLERNELARCPVQNEWLPQVGIGSRTWILTPFGRGRSFSTAILHAHADRGLDQLQSRWLQRLHSHLQQAMHLHLTLEAARTERQAIEAGLDALATGVILLDRTSQVIFANRTAQRQFGRGQLRLTAGRLAGASPAEDAAIRRLVASVTARRTVPHGGTINLPSCRLQAIPVGEPGAALDDAVRAVLLVHETSARAVDPLSLLPFGLTRAEAKLAASLANGETLEAYAARTDRAIGTVRAQLRTVFNKTNTHRQSELVLYVHRTVGCS